MSAYAIHHDIAGRGYDTNSLLFQGMTRMQNCILISKYSHTTGIGTSNKLHLIREYCEIISYINPAFRTHNFTFKNCFMRNNGSIAPIVLQE